MSAIIKTLKTTTNDVEQSVYPKTILEAVVDAETNETLDVILDNLNEKIDNIEPGSGGGTTYELSSDNKNIVLTGGDGSTSQVRHYPIHDIVNTNSNVYVCIAEIQIVGDSDTRYPLTFKISIPHASLVELSLTPYGTSTAGGLDVNSLRGNYNNGYLEVYYSQLSTQHWGIYIGQKNGTSVGDIVTVELISPPINDNDIKITWRSDCFNTPIPGDSHIINDTTFEDITVIDTLNVKSPYFPALNLTRTGTTTDYTAIQFNNDNGMLGGLAMNTVSGDMNVVDANGVGYPMLDKRNYNQYALPLTGGTVTGDVTFEKNIVSTTGHNFFYNGLMNARLTSSSKAGYWKFLTVKAVSGCSYAGAMISFKVTPRYSNRGLVNLYISNGATANTGFSISMSQESGAGQCYFIQSSTGVFDIYLKHDAWAEATITDLVFPQYQRNRFTLTWSNTHVDSLPSGTTAATAYTVLDTTNYSAQIPAATQSAVGLMSAADKKKLDYLMITAKTDVGVDDYSANAIGYVKTSLFGQTDAALYKQVYDDKWVHEIAGDYRTGQLAVRGKNNGTWQSWRTVLDSGNYGGYALPIAGGTITGNIQFVNDRGIKDINGNWMIVKSSSVASPLGSIVNKYPIYIGNTSSTSETTYVRGQYLALHGATLINANTNIGVTSDKRVKTNESLLIDEIDKYNQFFDNLQPRKYNYIRDEEGKAKSIGFFAQEVHQALLDADLTLEDFGGINIQESFLEGQAEGDDECVWYQDFYSLAYDEFIPIIVSKIQHLEKMYNARLEEIENDYNAKLQSLEERIIKLEEAKA
jgi:hypothetical protein